MRDLLIKSTCVCFSSKKQNLTDAGRLDVVVGEIEEKNGGEQCKVDAEEVLQFIER